MEGLVKVLYNYTITNHCLDIVCNKSALLNVYGTSYVIIRNPYVTCNQFENVVCFN